jgi:hypothetical protein
MTARPTCARRFGLLGLVAFSLGIMGNVLAQQSPFIPAEVDQALRNELSGEMAYDHLRTLTQFHRVQGSPDLLKALRYIEAQARAAGLSEVQLVEQKYDGQSWVPKSAELWMIEPERRKLASFAEVPVTLANNSRTTHAEAELVDVGLGESASDYEGIDVAGKVVLAYGRLSKVMEQAVWQRGALGIVSYSSTRNEPLMEYPDQIAWGGIPFRGGKDKKPGTFAFMVSPRTAMELRRIMKPEPDLAIFGEGRKPNPQRVRLKIDIEADFIQPAKQWYVMATLPGSSIHDQDIVLTAHAQEEKFSANDDGSGSANLLEIGRTLARLVREGVLPPPRRDIVFWWTNEVASELQFFKDRPQARDSMLVNLNQDMVGARQSIGPRVQHITRLPMSRPSFLEAVVASVADYVIKSNNGFLAARQAGYRGIFPNPIFSRLGSREPYNARLVPYFNSTDHAVFNEGVIGVPGITLTNWPDELIHSSDDDLWNIDRTQLKRNAFVVAAAAWFIANVGDDEVPQLAGLVLAQGKARIGQALDRAIQLITGRAGDKGAYRDARILLEETVARQQEAIGSIQALAESARNRDYLVALQRSLARELDFAAEQLDMVYRRVTGSRAPKPSLSAEEKAATLLTPRNHEDLSEYFTRRKKVKSKKSGLHPLMASEVFNFIDGRRSLWQIYRAVLAEALLAGEFYYGTVTFAGVKNLIDQAVEKGAVVVDGK